MNAPKRVKTATLNLRVSPEFKERLEKEAAKTMRSVTNYIEATLLELWDRDNKPTGGRKRG